jgi:succinate dehydrogenase/fumarate reductase-like Fe-S protein
MTCLATLVVRRGEPGDDPAWSRFEVAYEPGQSVLDGLRRIRIEQEPRLAFRYSCINANACKECMMLIDGEVRYACTARLEEREMRLEPLPNKMLLRDLATEIAPPDERLAHAEEKEP